MTSTPPFRSASCEGERCACGAPAAAKVEETIFHDDPNPRRHPLTAYVCEACFGLIMGPAAPRRAPNVQGRSTPAQRAEHQALTCGALAARMRSRVAFLEESAGSAQAAITGPGIGIGYLLGRELANALENAAELLGEMGVAAKPLSFSPSNPPFKPDTIDLG
jgi:hypothetical protein